MGQMVFAYIFVKGWIIDPDEHRFFYQSGEVVFLPFHYTKIVDDGIVTTDGTVVIDRGGGLEVFLQPFSKCSSCLTNIFFITLQPITFEPVYYATFLLVMWSLSLGATSSSFRVLPLLKWTSMPYFFPMFLIVSLRPSSYGTVIWALVFVWMFLLFCLVFGASIFNFILLIVQFGYLHAVRAFCMCVCSSSSNLLLEQMIFALCRSVLMILNLLFMAWWLSHYKYWFVWVGFL